MRSCPILTAGLFFVAPAFAAEPYPFSVKVAGAGPPAILIPGLACDGAVWDSTLDWMKKGRECHVLTLAGFAGQKPVDGPFLDTVSRGVLAYAADKKLVKPVLVGHSLGASLAVKVAAEGGEKIGGLACVDGFPCVAALFVPNSTPEALRELGDTERKRLEAMPREEFLQSQKAFFGRWLTGEKMALASSWIEASDPKTVAKAKGELFASDLRPLAEKIGCRVLVLAAYNDGYQAFAQSADEYGGMLRKQFPKSAALAVHPNCKHFLMWDEPAWYREKLSAFFAGK